MAPKIVVAPPHQTTINTPLFPPPTVKFKLPNGWAMPETYARATLFDIEGNPRENQLFGNMVASGYNLPNTPGRSGSTSSGSKVVYYALPSLAVTFQGYFYLKIDVAGFDGQADELLGTVNTETFIVYEESVAAERASESETKVLRALRQAGAPIPPI